MSSTVSYLSPIIDLSKASVKTISNKVESADGREDRFGRRNQVLKFYPVYTFLVEGVDTENGEAISTGQSIGQTTKASGQITKVSGTTVWVKLKTTNAFTPNELLTFESDTFNGTPSVSTSGASQVIFEIPNSISPPSYVTARNPSVLAQKRMIHKDQWKKLFYGIRRKVF